MSCVMVTAVAPDSLTMFRMGASQFLWFEPFLRFRVSPEFCFGGLQSGPGRFSMGRSRTGFGRLANGGCQRPARNQMLPRKHAVARLPRVEGLSRRSRVTKEIGMHPFRMSSPIMLALIESKPVVGSSNRIMSGSSAIAFARLARFCMPPESSDGYLSVTSASAQKVQSNCARLRFLQKIRSSQLPKRNILPDGHQIEQCSALKQHSDFCFAASSPADWIASANQHLAGIGLDQSQYAFEN